jgi:tRNA-splicing ligase RtcB
MKPELRSVGPGCWELPRQGDRKTAARIYATEEMLDSIYEDRVHMQLANVASLPGLVGPAMAMPDFHWGYGFPIGGVAAFDLEEGVISPGGVGYDINCGVRLLSTRLEAKEVSPRLRDVVEQLFRDVPTGVGSSGVLSVNQRELEEVVRQGARWAVGRGFGSESDLEFIEEGGTMDRVDTEAVTPRSWKRGQEQLGTLGSGNHFLEIGYVEEVYDFKRRKPSGSGKTR